MSAELIAPLSEPDADLRNYPYTPIFRARLFGSSFHARASDAEWRAGVTLWLKSWEQFPAGSLPDDDIELCRLAELGRDLRRWRKVKAVAMRGWKKCSDGRLYHKTVAQAVNDAWQIKRSQRERTEKARASRHRPPVTNIVTENVTTPVTETVTGSNRREGKRRDSSEPKGSGAASAPELLLNDAPPEQANGKSHPAPSPKSAVPDLKKQVYDRGKQVFGSSAGGIITNVLKAKENKYAKALALIEDAAEKRDPVSWINAWLWEHGPPGLQIGPMAPAL